MINFFSSGKTEFQTTQQNRARRTVQFERKPSQRYARRQSHVLREKNKNKTGESPDKEENKTTEETPGKALSVGSGSVRSNVSSKSGEENLERVFLITALTVCKYYVNNILWKF